MQTHEILSCVICAYLSGQTDGRTNEWIDMTMLIVAFRK